MYKKVADDYIDLGTKSKIHAAVIRDQCYQALHVKYAHFNLSQSQGDNGHNFNQGYFNRNDG